MRIYDIKKKFSDWVDDNLDVGNKIIVTVQIKDNEGNHISTHIIEEEMW